MSLRHFASITVNIDWFNALCGYLCSSKTTNISKSFSEHAKKSLVLTLSLSISLTLAAWWRYRCNSICNSMQRSCQSTEARWSGGDWEARRGGNRGLPGLEPLQEEQEDPGTSLSRDRGSDRRWGLALSSSSITGAWQLRGEIGKLRGPAGIYHWAGKTLGIISLFWLYRIYRTKFNSWNVTRWYHVETEQGIFNSLNDFNN